MPLLIRAPLPLQPSPHFSFSTPTPLPPPLPRDRACASSAEQRKPKTRGILLKGVSQQPDINNLHVCRAESKPLGICGFTRLCVCTCVALRVFQYLPLECSIHLHVSCLLFVPLSMLDVWYDTRSANCGSIEPKLQRCVSASYFLNKETKRLLFFLLHRTRVVKSVHLRRLCLKSLIHCTLSMIN